MKHRASEQNYGSFVVRYWVFHFKKKTIIPSADAYRSQALISYKNLSFPLTYFLLKNLIRNDNTFFLVSTPFFA